MNIRKQNKKFAEEDLENAIIDLILNYKDYLFIHGESIHRKYDEVLLKDDLKNFLLKKYPDLDGSEVNSIISRLENTPFSNLYEGNRETFWILNEGFDFDRKDNNKKSLHINFIDFNNINNNSFKIINQFSVQGYRLRRPDLLLFINGIPIVIFEFKTAIDENKTIYDAWEQIHLRYSRDIPKLMKYCSISVLSDGANTKLGTIFTPYEFYYSWNKIEKNKKISKGIETLYSMIDGVFNTSRLLEIYKDFIYYPDKDKSEEAIICRYPQFFGANKMFSSINKNIKPLGDGKGGIYFGATGCGKSHTMLFLVRKLILYNREVLKNPTILIITDREDLDDQISKLFVSSKKFLNEDNIKSIENRDDLNYELNNIKSGGVFITTIQKFCETIGLLSDRSNIICISDEAHRTQTNIVGSIKKEDDGIYSKYGFAKYLRDSFPNATYCGFTGTPIETTLSVFGPIIDQYTMKESSSDGITVGIEYEQRITKVLISKEQSKEIQKYYDDCISIGANPAQVEESKKAMSKMRQILGHPDRIKILAEDIISHYENLISEKPKIVQKAMIACSTREIGHNLLKEIIAKKPDWNIPISFKDENIDDESKKKTIPIEKIKLVATQGANDSKELFEICGTKQYRKSLSKEFKNIYSNFKIAIVVDMWTTGFDVPSLAVMYIDKPLHKHNLIQTISRVNRNFNGKYKGLIVDYVGIKNDMLEALKTYGNIKDQPFEEITNSVSIFRNNLDLIKELMHKFDDTLFYEGSPVQRLKCLSLGTEFIQITKKNEEKFMNFSLKLKSSFEICSPSGILSKEEISKAQYYFALRSIIYKQVKNDTPDSEVMNNVVEKMVQEAISFTGIQNILDQKQNEQLFGDEIKAQLEKIDLPITKFNALKKLINKSISEYRKINKVKAIEFYKKLKKIVEEYNNRDFKFDTSDAVRDFVNSLSESLLTVHKNLKEDRDSFKKMGVSFEEKAFFDILVKVRNTHKFEYNDNKCLNLAKKIKLLVDDKSQYADWSSRDDIKNLLSMDLTVLLHDNGYPPEWDEEVFKKVLDQAENLKKTN